MEELKVLATSIEKLHASVKQLADEADGLAAKAFAAAKEPGEDEESREQRAEDLEGFAEELGSARDALGRSLRWLKSAADR